MKVGFIYGQKIYPPGTGGSIHGYQLARYLTQKGVRLFSFYWGESKNPWISHFRGRELFKFLSLIDVLYLRVEWNGGPEQFSFLKLLKLFKLPVVWEINGTPEEILYAGSTHQDVRKIGKRLSILGKLVNATICVTDEICEYSIVNFKLTNVHCIPNGSDPDLFFPAQRSLEKQLNSPLRVAWIGTTNAGWQDMDILYRAMKKLENCNIEFWIFGDPKFLPHEITRNILVKGIVPYDEIGGELGKADVGAHFFRNDMLNGPVLGSPLKIFDYMSSGLAIVTQADGQRKKLLEEENCGLPVSNNVEDLCRALMFLEKNRNLCYGMGQKGRYAVERYYNWDRAANETIKLLEKVMSKQH